MSTGGKGSLTRRTAISADEFASNYDRIFGKKTEEPQAVSESDDPFHVPEPELAVVDGKIAYPGLTPLRIASVEEPADGLVRATILFKKI